jgi:hypothetical protein
VPKVDRPPMIQTEEDRRQMLSWLIQENGGIMAVSRNSGISRGHLRRLVRGTEVIAGEQREASILEASVQTITGLLEAFGLSDERAWEMLAIPVERRANWRSLPQGGERPLNPQVVDIQLEEPLTGDLFLPRGYTIMIDESDTHSGLQVVSVNGRLYALRPDALPAKAAVRGKFIGTRP